MTADRYTLRLYWRSTRELEEDFNLDPRDDDMLRATLERLVEKKRGTLRLDLSEWRMDVHSLGGGQVKAECKIASNGATVVKR